MTPHTKAAEIAADKAFDQWCFLAVDPTVLIDGRPVPALTTVLFRVCAEDTGRFEDALRFLRMAFDAGRAVAHQLAGEMRDE